MGPWWRSPLPPLALNIIDESKLTSIIYLFVHCNRQIPVFSPFNCHSFSAQCTWGYKPYMLSTCSTIIAMFIVFTIRWWWSSCLLDRIGYVRLPLYYYYLPNLCNCWEFTCMLNASISSLPSKHVHFPLLVSTMWWEGNILIFVAYGLFFVPFTCSESIE